MKRGTGNPWRRLGLPARVGWLVVGGYGIAAALVVASSVWGSQGAYATRPIDEIVSVLCLVFAAACAARRLGQRSGAAGSDGWRWSSPC